MFKNPEFRQFVNEHEAMVQNTFERMFAKALELIGAKKEPPKLRKTETVKPSDFQNQLRQAVVRPSPKKEQVVTAKQKQLVVSVKEVYLSWLMDVFRIDLDLHVATSLGKDPQESPRRDRRSLGLPEEGQVVLDEEQRKKLMISLKEDEMTKVYLSKRLCQMAKSSGKLQKVLKEVHEAAVLSQVKTTIDKLQVQGRPLDEGEGPSDRSFSLTQVRDDLAHKRRERSRKNRSVAGKDSKQATSTMYGKWYLKPKDFHRQMVQQ